MEQNEWFVFYSFVFYLVLYIVIFLGIESGISSTFIDKHHDQVTTCSVREKSSGSLRPCKFPFIFKGEMFFSCTTKTGKNDDGSFKRGAAWCSTNTDDNDNHIIGGQYYGDCERENCPSVLDLDWVANDEAKPELDEDGNYVFFSNAFSTESLHQLPVP